MSTKHTSGPWQVYGPFNETTIVANVDIDEYGMHTYDSICEVDDQNAQWPANARLVASAPELLAVLKLVLSDLVWGQERDIAPSVENVIREVVAKAEGRS